MLFNILINIIYFYLLLNLFANHLIVQGETLDEAFI